ncbi:NmrA-like family protein [Colletotrichum karsti]|uniref:NmrA-like family protein n=1 Tax=Colletotrichum karsti TaxID=1095194 RepID=A0A9P6LPK5_9PEZI|nr:NmrA-like family protein [Colletotrichum karsti]KAF9881010.1 NmrA-like family protein [Colletotrichum karsti]
MKTSNPKVLIVGATGRTGSATITALLSRPNPPSILALTRSPSSPKSQSLLSSHPSSTITLVEGDPASPAPIFASHKDISAIYLVTVPPADEAQGIPVIDAAVENGIPHLVLSSIDRGGDEASWTNPTPVPHFAAKHRLELYLRDRTAGTGTRWTVLRPAGFMDQYVSDAGVMGSVMGGLWASMPRDRRLQLVSARDIGVFAARALVEGPGEWGGKALSLAGDEISFAEAEETFERVVGRRMPQSWGFVAHAVRWASEDAGRSMEWFEREGYRADIAKLRAMEPSLQTWEMWLRESSGWTEKRES